MRIRYLGHSAFEVETADYLVYFDPWITGNPKGVLESVYDIEKADYVFVSHEHEDHGFEDAVKICKQTGAKLVAAYDTAASVTEEGVKVVGGNSGGKIALADDLTVYFTVSFHPTKQNQPVGFVLATPEGNVYHAGDTALFSDMKLIADKVKVTVAMLPIGDVFTMDEEDAIKAADFLKAEYVIPMHYGTFDKLTGNPNVMRNLMSNPDRLKVLAPGEELTVNRLV